MKYKVMNLIGVLAGLAVGSVLAPPALFAGLTPLHVTWDGSQCPSGNYTITTTARNSASGEVFQATSLNIRLPAGTIGQDFPNLPDGTYLLVASVEGPDEPTLYSRSQTLTVGTSAPAPPEDLADIGGRRRPPTATATGVAQPRSTVTTNQAGGSTATQTRTEVQTIETEVSLAWALETVVRIASGRHGGGRASHVGVVDEDGDGEIDYVTITIGRVVRTWRVSGG